MKQQSAVLIVDDQRIARKSLEMLLRSEDYRLAFAENGPEALSMAAKLVPDLILLDVMMPDMDGFEVCRRLRAHALLAEVPIIMITALDDADSRLQGIEAGADDFVSKPFDGVELRARVRSITRLNRYRRLLVERVRFRWVVEQAEEGYLVLGENDEILYANPRARLYLDLPHPAPSPSPQRRGEVESFMDLVGRQYHCEPQEAWENWPHPSKEQSPRYLVRPESPTARAFWLQVDALALPAGSDMARTVRMRDVTEKMNALRDMRGFHAMITHKLRTPVGHIIGSLDLLAKYYRDEISNPDIAELFETAHKGAQRISRDIDDILRYLRDLPILAESGEAFSLSDLTSVVTLIDSVLELESVNVLCEGCPSDARLALSESAMELVLWEILENAKKFHPQKSPTVDIYATCATSKKLRLRVRDEGSHTTVERHERIIGPTEVTLRISDDGLTLSPEQLGRVWTPYYQGEKHFTGEVAGMGLGLTMVSTLVWTVGGTCRLYNLESGPGVVVELILPLA